MILERAESLDLIKFDGGNESDKDRDARSDKG